MKNALTAGVKFNRLTIIEILPQNKGERLKARCQCDCGNKHVVETQRLQSGNTKSCGCLKLSVLSERCTSHGGSKLPEYQVWFKMKERCQKPSSKDWPYYGGRGITVCERWNDFGNFLMDMGRRPFKRAELDRVDNSQGYSRENCRWATHTENCNNQRSNIYFTANNMTLSIAEWSAVTGISSANIRRRFHLGWAVEDVIGKPLRKGTN